MKVAVCVGGVMYPDSGPLMEALMKKFPQYDFFFGIWKGRENALSEKLGAWPFDEHEPSYHPYFDVNIEGMSDKILVIRAKMKANPTMPMIAKALHQTKQILMHSYMLDRLPPEYDMVVRTRYDIKLIDDNIDFVGLLKSSHDKNCAIGLAKRFKQNPQIFDPKGTTWHRYWEQYLMDLFLIHPRSLFDKARMLALHEKKELLAAEFGWYQVLSQPYGDTHQNFMCNISITSRGDK